VSAVWTWVRLDLRTRVRSLAVMALLVALTTGVVLTAVAGARRGATAVDRLLDRTKPATIAVLPNEPGFDWDAVAALPGVEAIARFPLSGYELDGRPAEDVADFAYADDEIMDEIERPVVLEGRLADPSRDDEAVVTAAFEGSYGKGVGDTVTITLFTPEQIDETYDSNLDVLPAGPSIEATIVGVVRSPWFSDNGGDGGVGRLIPSPGLYDSHTANLIGDTEVVYLNALVRLEGGAAAVPGFREQLAEVSGRRDIEFMDLSAEAQHVREVADFEADALLAFAAAAFIAAVFLVGQSVARYVSGATQDLQVLSAVGMPPRHVRVAATVAPALAGTVGALVGVGAAFLASSRFPTGTAASIEPSPGRHADLTVLLAGVVVIPLLVAAGAVLGSWATSRSLAGDGRRSRSRVSSLTARAGAPVPVSVGASFALDRGRGAHAVPVYPAVVGAVVGVLGVVAALTFAAGVSDAAAHPERFGQISQLESFFGFNDEDFVPADDALAIMAADPDVVAVNDTRQAVVESGAVDIPLFSLDPVGQPPPIVVMEGRLVESAAEVTLAPESAAALDVNVGDSVELTGSRSSGAYTVSGIAFVPEGSHNSYDTGAWMSAAGYDELVEGFKFHTADVTLRSGADRDVVAARLGTAVADVLGQPDAAGEVLRPRPPPPRLAELQQIQRLPLFLAAFLALLAVAAVGHALATAVRRRRHDLAVLRAVGVTRAQTRVTVLVQAAVLALVGLVLGVPLGVALGRTLWRSVADTTPLYYVPPVAVWALVLVAPIALLAAVILAAWPSQRAVSLRVAHVLRTE
jgi:ABC-type lipoprotein release transport system permease subunit